MNILQVCAYAADYEGNFMKSLYSLEFLLNQKGHNVYYVFPENAQEKVWCKKLSERTKVFFLPLVHARIRPKTYFDLKRIIKNNKINLIHSHFELYDIPCNIMSNKNISVYWHLHDPIKKSDSKTRNILNKLQYSFFQKECN